MLRKNLVIKIQINSSLFKIVILIYHNHKITSRLINSTIKEPILTYSRRENLSTNEDIPNEIDNIYKDSSGGINYLNENHNYMNTLNCF
jgi:hypothetical protein